MDFKESRIIDCHYCGSFLSWAKYKLFMHKLKFDKVVCHKCNKTVLKSPFFLK